MQRGARATDQQSGEVIAELDVVIEGPLGSSRVAWLIECRDRPSDGPAPRSWIEQLASRRADLDFDRVFAVSTTGFSQPARTLAARHGIRLRSVNRIEDIAHDFNCKSFEIRDFKFEKTGTILVGARVGRFTEAGEPSFRRLGQKEWLRLQDFVIDILGDSNALPTTEGVFEIDFNYPRRCHLRTPSGRILQIDSVRFPGRLRMKISQATILAANVYADDDRIIGKQGQVKWQGIAGPGKATVTIANNGTVKVDVREDQLPVGTHPRFMLLERTRVDKAGRARTSTHKMKAEREQRPQR